MAGWRFICKQPPHPLSKVVSASAAVVERAALIHTYQERPFRPARDHCEQAPSSCWLTQMSPPHLVAETSTHRIRLPWLLCEWVDLLISFRTEHSNLLFHTMQRVLAAVCSQALVATFKPRPWCTHAVISMLHTSPCVAKKHSSNQWIARQRADAYVREVKQHQSQQHKSKSLTLTVSVGIQAQQEGYRSRSAFKLLQIDTVSREQATHQYHMFTPHTFPHCSGTESCVQATK